MSTRRSGPSWRHFYPRSPCGERPLSSAMSRWACLFLSTLSLRRATLLTGYCPVHDIDFYPRSPCGERRRRSVKLFRQNYISIHALLAESDISVLWMVLNRLLFLSTLSLRRATSFNIFLYHTTKFLSTLSLRRATVRPAGRPAYHTGFLSTLSLRRATHTRTPAITHHHDFYPRSPCGERLFYARLCFCSLFISIHALLAESDHDAA